MEIRYVIMYLCKKYTNMYLKQIAGIFDMDHTTAMHGIASIENRIDTEPDFKDKVEALAYQLNHSEHTALAALPKVDRPFKTVILGL